MNWHRELTTVIMALFTGVSFYRVYIEQGAEGVIISILLGALAVWALFAFLSWKIRK